MADNPGNESQFTEMLRIEIDVASFQEQLNLLKQAYQDFIAELSAMGGPNPLAQGAASMAEGLQQVKDSLADVTKAQQESIDQRLAATQQAASDEAAIVKTGLDAQVSAVQAAETKKVEAKRAALTEKQNLMTQHRQAEEQAPASNFTVRQFQIIQEGLAKTLTAVEALSSKVTDAIVTGFDAMLEKTKAADNAIAADAEKTASKVGGAFKKEISELEAKLADAVTRQIDGDAALQMAYAKDEDVWRTVLINKQKFFEEYQSRLTQMQEASSAVRSRLTEAELELRTRTTAGTGLDAVSQRELRARELEIEALRQEATAREQLEKQTAERIATIRNDIATGQMARSLGFNQHLAEMSKEELANFVKTQKAEEAAVQEAADASVSARRKALEIALNDERKAAEAKKALWQEAVDIAEQANARILEIEKQRLEAETTIADREKNLYAGVQYRGETRAPETGELTARQNEIAALKAQVQSYTDSINKLREISKTSETEITADKLNELDKRLRAVVKEVDAETAACEAAVTKRLNVEQAANARYALQNEQLYRDQLAFKEKLVQAEQLAQQKITEYREAAAAQQRKLEERTGSFSFTEGQVIATKRVLAAYEDAIGKIQALFDRLQEVGRQAANNIDIAFTESNQKLVTSFEGTVGRIQTGLDRIVATEQQSGEGTGFFARIQSAVKSLPGDLAETAVSLTKIMVLWGLIGKAIDVVKAAVMALPKAIETGFAYLSQMQEKSVELQAVIAQTTHLADGFGPNFQKAGVAANAVVEQLRIKAAQLGLDFEKLVVTFKNLSEGGAPGMVKNLQEQVELTTTLELAMRAVASDQQESRRIQQEIPKLLDGSIDSQSRFLHVTHMTVDEWNALLKAGMEHHDLLQRVQERLKEFVQAGETLPGTWENMVKQVGLFNSMLAASLAKPLFVELSRLLQDMIRYFVQNREQLERMAEGVGEVVKKVVELTEKIVVLTEKVVTLGGKVQWVGNAFDQTAHAIGVAIDGTQHLVDILGAFVTGDGKKLGELWDKLSQPGAQVQQAKDITNILQQSIAGSPTNEGRNVKEATDLHKAYTDAIKQQKDAVEELNLKTQELERSRQISPQEANARRLSDLKNEESAVVQLGYKYRIALATDPIVSAEEKTKRLKELAIEEATELTRIHKEALQARTQANADAFSRESASYREQIEDIKSKFTQQVAIVKEAEATHTITTAEAVEKRKQLYKQELDAVIGVIEDARKRFASLNVVKSDTIFSDLNKAVAQAKVTYANEIASLTKEGATSEAAIERIEYNSRVQLLEDFNKHQQALVKAAVSDKVLSETAGVKRLIELEEEDYQRRHDVLQREANDLALNERTRAEANARIVLLEQQHTEQVVLNEQRMATALEKETTLRNNLAKQEAALAVKDIELKIQASNREVQTIEKTIHNSQLLVNAKLREAEVNIEVARTELLNAAAKGKTAEEIQKLINQLHAAEQQYRAVAQGAVTQQGQAAQSRGGGVIQAEIQQEQQIKRNIQEFQTLYTVTQILVQAKKLEKAAVDAEISTLAAWVAGLRKMAADQPGNTKLKEDADIAAKKLEDLRHQSEALDKALQGSTDDMNSYDQLIQEAKQSLQDHKLTLDNVKDALGELFPVLKIYKQMHDTATSGVQKFALAVADVASTIGQLKNIIGAIQAGKQQGGVMGAIGGGLSSIGGMVATVNPLVGGIMEGVGQIFSFIGGMFDKKAREIMRSIQGQMNETMKELQFGQIPMIVALKELQNQYNQAETELHGSKRQQMTQQLGDQIRQMQYQMQQTVAQFNNMVQVGRLNNTVLQDFLNTWQQINKQAMDYINAGGSIKVAQEYIAQQLKQQQLQAQDQFLQGEQQAIQDALQLNDLYKQAVQLEQDKFNLIKNEKQTEFNILTQDSIERRIPQAIQIANQLNTQRQNFAQQLAQINDQQDQLNYQLKVQSEKVAKEQQMYGLATDIAGLHRQDEALSNYFLDEQLVKTLALKDIAQGIYSAGNFELLTNQFKTLIGIGKYFQNDNPYFAFGGNSQNPFISTQEGAAFQQAQLQFQNPNAPGVAYNPNALYNSPAQAGPIAGDIGLTQAIQNLQLSITEYNQTLAGDIANAMPTIAQMLANQFTNPFVSVGKSMDLLTAAMNQLETQIANWLKGLGFGPVQQQQVSGPAVSAPVGPPLPATPAVTTPPTPAPVSGTATSNQILNAINTVQTAVATASNADATAISSQTTQIVAAITKLVTTTQQAAQQTSQAVSSGLTQAGGGVNPAGAVSNTPLSNNMGSAVLAAIKAAFSGQGFSSLVGGGNNAGAATIVDLLTKGLSGAGLDKRMTGMQIGQVVINAPAGSSPQNLADSFIAALTSRLAIGSHF